MWWGDGPPAGCRIVMKRWPDRKLHYYPDWQQRMYLPLAFGKEYATGLTVYMNSDFSNVIGIVSHGSSNFVFGEAVCFDSKREESCHFPGIPLHLDFSRGEHLTSAWLHLDSMQPHEAIRGMLVVGISTLTPDKFQTEANYFEITANHKHWPSSTFWSLSIIPSEEARRFGVGSSQH